MKNLKKHLVLGLIVLFVGISFNVHARQNTKTWTWKKHRLKFDLPLNWKINSNSGNKFGATGDKASLLFIPWHDSNVATAKQVAMRAYQQSTMVSNKRIISQQRMASKGGLEKYMLLVEGTQRDKRTGKIRRVQMGIMGFINPNSTVNMYARFVWWKSDAQNSNRTYKIANSVRGY